MSVAVCVASHTSRVSTAYLLYLFVLLLLVVLTPRCKMWLLISDRMLPDMTTFFMSFSPTFEDDTSRVWWVFFSQQPDSCTGVCAFVVSTMCKKNLHDVYRKAYAIAHRLQVDILHNFFLKHFSF